MMLATAHYPPTYPITGSLPVNAGLPSFNSVLRKLKNRASFYYQARLFALRSGQLPLTWQSPSLLHARRGTLIPAETIIALLGMLSPGLTDEIDSEILVDVDHLIQQAQQGSREAVATLYRIHVKTLYRYIACRVPSTSDAEDLTAEVFVRMVEGLPGYEITGAPFVAWLYRIAASRISDFYRSKANRPGEELHENFADDESSFEETLVEQQDVASLRRALQQLPDEHQTILILRFVERKSHEEVAMLLGRSVTAVKSAQHRALTRLSELLGSDHKARHYIRGAHG